MRGTDFYRQTIVRSHRIEAWVDLIGHNQEVLRLPVTDGDVKVDRTAEFRRTCNLTAYDSTGSLLPSDVESNLAPYGSEIRPYRGAYVDDSGVPEMLPLGVFRVSKVSAKDTTGGAITISIESTDRSRKIARNGFSQPWIIAVGTNIITAIKDILARDYDDLDFDAISTTMATTAVQVFDMNTSPWAAVQTLARSLACEIYFNVDGDVVIAPSPDISALPSADFNYIEGENCAMIDVDQSWSDDPGYNGVIVSGESVGDTAPPVRGEAWDDEPTSKTYYLGPYGRVPLFITDQNVKTNEEAQAVAEQELRNRLGASSLLSVNGIVNAGYEGGDVVSVRRKRSNIDGLYIADAFNIPLRGGVQGLTLRQKQQVPG